MLGLYLFNVVLYCADPPTPTLPSRRHSILGAGWNDHSNQEAFHPGVFECTQLHPLCLTPEESDFDFISR